ncbi:hypothetical protein FRC12_001953 [Ceratobasidium sp. 428]|nr:hypothetical protein FRC12_001953 [Ceratobasidium sp. 428]
MSLLHLDSSNPLQDLLMHLERWLPFLGFSPVRLGSTGVLPILLAPGVFVYRFVCAKLLHTAERPPIVPHWIPWLGSAQQIQKDPDGLFRKARRELGPVFGVRAFGTTLYHITDPDLIVAVYKQPHVFGASPMQATFLKQIFGLSLSASSEIGSIIESLRRRLSPTYFPPLASNFLRHIRSEIDKLPANTPISLRSIAIQPMRNADCGMLFGSSFLESRYNQEIVSAFETFSSSVPLLAVNFLASLMPATITARQTLLDALSSYFEAGLPEDASELLKEFVELAQNLGWSTRNQAAYGLSLMWPLLANAPYAAYWLLAFHLHRPEGLAPLFREAISAIASGRDLAEVVRDSSATPYLDACISETIRLASDSYSMRWVREGEHKLGGYVFKAGDQVACNLRGVHMNEGMYAQPDKFEPERFMDGKEHVKGRFAPFGGGFSVCSGRHLGLSQIKAFLIVLLSEFDIYLEDEEQAVPAFSPSNRGFGMIRPLGDMKVLLMRRKYVFGPGHIVDSPLEEYPPGGSIF